MREAWATESSLLVCAKRNSTEFHKLDAPWEWRYFNFNEPAACLFTFEYDVVVRMRGGSVEISGTPGAVAPWDIVVAVIYANGYDITTVLAKAER